MCQCQFCTHCPFREREATKAGRSECVRVCTEGTGGSFNCEQVRISAAWVHSMKLFIYIVAIMEPEVVSVELTEDDIPGARLPDPLDKHTNQALRWWLLCHGVQVPVSTTKAKLISRYKI